MTKRKIVIPYIFKQVSAFLSFYFLSVLTYRMPPPSSETKKNTTRTKKTAAANEVLDIKAIVNGIFVHSGNLFEGDRIDYLFLVVIRYFVSSYEKYLPKLIIFIKKISYPIFDAKFCQRS